ncbi:transposase [Mesorhizobium tamadayense]|uniref:Transposase n=1 Tax=Mesorhizobium tamadayense TaxID=425306 RepID=A0A3P3EUY4_9HYPH|nr:transposase [Mesorhizobium tamadayense]
MQRRKFSREFKLEAVRLVKDRGLAVAHVTGRMYSGTGQVHAGRHPA